MFKKEILAVSSGGGGIERRGYYRHSSDMGTVMVWNDNGGSINATLILDMKYQTSTNTWGVKGEDISGITNYTSAPFAGQSNNLYILGSSNSSTSAYDGQTDAILDAKFNWRDAHISKSNTNALVSTYPSGSYAANYCRSKTVNGVGCDLPNMQTLVRIFCDRAIIHSLDASDTRDWWSSWFDKGNVWTSSESDSNYAWCIGYNGRVSVGFKNTEMYCIPIIQL